jgi:hypothetical protein
VTDHKEHSTAQLSTWHHQYVEKSPHQQIAYLQSITHNIINPPFTTTIVSSTQSADQLFPKKGSNTLV